MAETIDAVRVLNEHPDTVFTVLTGAGRFFSSGADVRGKFKSTVTIKENADHLISRLWA